MLFPWPHLQSLMLVLACAMADCPFLRHARTAGMAMHCTADGPPESCESSVQGVGFTAYENEAGESSARRFGRGGVRQNPHVCCVYAVAVGVLHQIHGFVREVQQPFFGPRIHWERGNTKARRQTDVQPFRP